MPAKSDKHVLEAAWIPEWRKVIRQSKKRLLPLYKPNLKQHQRAEFLLFCPCCGQPTRILEQAGLQDLNYQLIQAVLALEGLAQKVWFTYQNGDLFDWIKVPFALRIWACDACLVSKKAELADFETIFLLNLQTDGGHRPYFYFDQVLGCNTCQRNFLHPKQYQRFVHERYMVSDTKLQNCPDCQRKKNWRYWLEEILLPKTHRNPSYENLLKASRILLGNADPRALDFLRRAKNKAPSLEERQKLEQQIRIS